MQTVTVSLEKEDMSTVCLCGLRLTVATIIKISIILVFADALQKQRAVCHLACHIVLFSDSAGIPDVGYNNLCLVAQATSILYV